MVCTEKTSPIVHPVGRSGGYQVQIDGLRGLAILCVVMHHVGYHFPGMLDPGPVSVRLFFLLSGYLITTSIWKIEDKVLDGQVSYWGGLAAFHMRRLVRLAPVLYLLLFVGFLLGLSEYQEGLFWHAGFLTNFYVALEDRWPDSLSHLWSLSVQEQFYLVWPFILLLVSRPLLPFAFVAMILGAVAFRYGCLVTNASDFYRWMMLPGVFDSFAAGALVAFAKTKAKRGRILSGTAFHVSGAVALGCFIAARHIRFMPLSPGWKCLVETLENATLAWVFIGTVQGWRGWVGTVLESTFLTHIGKVSYSLYVFHVLVHVAIGPWLDAAGISVEAHGFLRFLIVAGAGIGLGTLSWRYLEMPLSAWIKSRAELLASSSAMPTRS